MDPQMDAVSLFTMHKAEIQAPGGKYTWEKREAERQHLLNCHAGKLMNTKPFMNPNPSMPFPNHISEDAASRMMPGSSAQGALDERLRNTKEYQMPENDPLVLALQQVRNQNSENRMHAREKELAPQDHQTDEDGYHIINDEEAPKETPKEAPAQETPKEAPKEAPKQDEDDNYIDVPSDDEPEEKREKITEAVPEQKPGFFRQVGNFVTSHIPFMGSKKKAEEDPMPVDI
jgi:hypothetical protein